MKKGDVFVIVCIVGIMGVKKMYDLILLCYVIVIDVVKVDLMLNESERVVDIVAVVSCIGKTGVEMEVFMVVVVSGLMIYDMCKVVSKDIVIGDVRLEVKVGGKSGNWSRREIE